MASIEYQSHRTIQPPTEYEHAYEQERGRWLRRRLKFYAATSLGFSLLASVPAFFLAREALDSAAILGLIFSNAASITVLIVAARVRPEPKLVLRIAFLFYVLASIWKIGVTHLTFGSDTSPMRAAAMSLSGRGANGLGKEQKPTPVITITQTDLDEGTVDQPLFPKATTDNESTQPATRPATTRVAIFSTKSNSYVDPLTINLGTKKIVTTWPTFRDNFIFLAIFFTLLTSSFTNHIFICLFIPWTVRESIKPALIILLTSLSVMLIDWQIGHAKWFLVLPVAAALPFSFVPGTLICWWRYGRFNKNFRLQFESKRYRAMERELSSARQVHEACLAPPRLDGPIRMNFVYEPMRQIGGDLLMLYPADLREPLKYLILLDVTGHGVAAALSVNRILGEIERLLAENQQQSVAQLARSLNRYVHLTMSPRNMFVTGLLLQIDEENGKLHCVNAGHPTAYHVCGKTRVLSPLESTSTFFGVLAADDFDVDITTIDFASSDALLGYTDGANEAADRYGTMLGMVGVQKIMEHAVGQFTDPSIWPDFARDQIIAHRQGPPQDDTIIFSLWRHE